MDMFVSSAARAAVPTLTPSPSDISAALMAAAHSLLDPLARGQAVDTTALREVMTAAFGGSDADGAWDWKTAYDAGEAATVLFLRKFGRGMRGRAGSAAALLAMLAKVTALPVLELQDGLQLRRAQVMGAFRVELTGFTDGMVERLKAMGLVSEIIAWKLRLFVPTAANGPTMLGTLMERFALVRIADRAAA